MEIETVSDIEAESIIWELRAKMSGEVIQTVGARLQGKVADTDTQIKLPANVSSLVNVISTKNVSLKIWHLLAVRHFILQTLFFRLNIMSSNDMLSSNRSSYKQLT